MYNFCNKVNDLYMSVANSSLCIMALLVCSIYFTVVTKLCGCFSKRHPWSDRFYLLLEYLFVLIPLLVGLTFIVLNILHQKHLHYELHSGNTYVSHTTCTSTNKLDRKPPTLLCGRTTSR